MTGEKGETKQFTTYLDSKLRLEVRATALKEGMNMKEVVEKLFRLYVESGSLETLETAYREYLKD